MSITDLLGYGLGGVIIVLVWRWLASHGVHILPGWIVFKGRWK